MKWGKGFTITKGILAFIVSLLAISGFILAFEESEKDDLRKKLETGNRLANNCTFPGNTTSAEVKTKLLEIERDLEINEDYPKALESYAEIEYLLIKCEPFGYYYLPGYSFIDTIIDSVIIVIIVIVAVVLLIRRRNRRKAKSNNDNTSL